MSKYIILILSILFSNVVYADLNATYECDISIIGARKSVKTIINYDGFRDKYIVNWEGRKIVFSNKDKDGIYTSFSFKKFQLLEVGKKRSNRLQDGFMSYPGVEVGRADYPIKNCRKL